MNIQPLYNRVLVRPIKSSDKTESGIYIPDTAKEKPNEGEVIAIGNGILNDSGKHIPLTVKTGDIVIYGKFSGTELKVDKEDLIIIPETDILAIQTK